MAMTPLPSPSSQEPATLTALIAEAEDFLPYSGGEGYATTARSIITRLVAALGQAPIPCTKRSDCDWPDGHTAPCTPLMEKPSIRPISERDPLSTSAVSDRITEYLSLGGLVNPERD